MRGKLKLGKPRGIMLGLGAGLIFLGGGFFYAYTGWVPQDPRSLMIFGTLIPGIVLVVGAFSEVLVGSGKKELDTQDPTSSQK